MGQSRAIGAARRLMLHHVDSAAHGAKVIFRDLLALAESLRSSVARLALVATSEALETFKSLLNDELTGAVAKLLKRAVDVNAFITNEADRALESAATHTAPQKCLAVLTQHMSHRSAAVRAKTARCMVICVQRMGGKLTKVKNAEELVKLWLKGLDDSHRDVRSYTRDIIVGVYKVSPDELLKLAERAQPEKGEKRVRQIVEIG